MLLICLFEIGGATIALEKTNSAFAITFPALSSSSTTSPTLKYLGDIRKVLSQFARSSDFSGSAKQWLVKEGCPYHITTSPALTTRKSRNTRDCTAMSGAVLGKRAEPFSLPCPKDAYFHRKQCFKGETPLPIKLFPITPGQIT